jgi:CRISPR/Cas system-associated exonuclease Cas4 (RecB family)
MNLSKIFQEYIESIPDEWNESNLHVTDLAVALEPEERKCPRELWLRLRGAEKRPLTNGQRLMFYQGHRLEKMLYDALVKAHGWQFVMKGVDLSDRLPERLVGTADIIVLLPDCRIVVDSKTTRGRNFDYLDVSGAKQSNALQVQTYCSALNDMDLPTYGKLFYIDREGQNAWREFDVPRDDQRVLQAYEVTCEIADGDCPAVLDPIVSITENKGPDSVRIKEPWQCSYCQYRGVSCEGALPEECRNITKVVGKIHSDGFVPLDEYKHLEEIVNKYLPVEV